MKRGEEAVKQRILEAKRKAAEAARRRAAKPNSATTYDEARLASTGMVETPPTTEMRATLEKAGVGLLDEAALVELALQLSQALDLRRKEENKPKAFSHLQFFKDMDVVRGARCIHRAAACFIPPPRLRCQPAIPLRAAPSPRAPASHSGPQLASRPSHRTTLAFSHSTSYRTSCAGGCALASTRCRTRRSSRFGLPSMRSKLIWEDQPMLHFLLHALHLPVYIHSLLV